MSAPLTRSERELCDSLVAYERARTACGLTDARSARVAREGWETYHTLVGARRRLDEIAERLDAILPRPTDDGTSAGGDV